MSKLFISMLLPKAGPVTCEGEKENLVLSCHLSCLSLCCRRCLSFAEDEDGREGDSVSL